MADQSIRIILFANGQVGDYSALAQLIRPTDYLIAADGGTHHALTLGRTPHAIIGDLDSVDDATLAKLSAQVYIERHPPDKNQTDLELALDYALRQTAEQNVSAIWIVGALGGRLDQMLGNIFILAQREWPLPVILADGAVRAQIVRPEQPLTLAARPGDTISALPLSDTVTGITYTGMRYPLENHTLSLGSTRGISNEVIAEAATVHVTSGKLLIVEMTSKG
ncbi:MAG: thiamine diphosphokinase [Caldilineaceae bacterium]